MASPVPFNKLEAGKQYMFFTDYIPAERVTIHEIKRIGPSYIQTIVQSRNSDGITAHINPRMHKPTYIPYSKGGKRQSRRRHRKRQTRRKSH